MPSDKGVQFAGAKIVQWTGAIYLWYTLPQ
nr:MAG TPA: hypothetical protein [Caudoviricetes sp.]